MNVCWMYEIILHGAAKKSKKAGNNKRKKKRLTPEEEKQQAELALMAIPDTLMAAGEVDDKKKGYNLKTLVTQHSGIYQQDKLAGQP